MPPEELIPALLLGMGKAWFDGDKFSEAAEVMERLLKEYPGSAAAPEAVYLRGVAGFKNTHDPAFLNGSIRSAQGGISVERVG